MPSMKKIVGISLVVFSVVAFGCKNESNKSNISDEIETISEDNMDELEAIEAEQAKDLENAYFYVIAPNGLSLRKSGFTDSEKILTIPFGAKLKQLAPIYTIDLTVENIDGSMMEVLYKGREGYVFSGFLSKYPVPNKDEATEAYVKRLKAIDSDVSFETKETDPDFHEGVVETTFLPSIEWHEAFYLTKATYSIPKSFSFPGHKGVKSETIEQPDKEDDVWSSFLWVKRNSTQLDTIQYSWRAEGSGYLVNITKPNQNQFKIEYTGFVD